MFPLFTFSECGCNKLGSKNERCDHQGKCYCKIGFKGKKCDQCQNGYYGKSCESKAIKKEILLDSFCCTFSHL